MMKHEHTTTLHKAREHHDLRKHPMCLHQTNSRVKLLQVVIASAFRVNHVNFLPSTTAVTTHYSSFILKKHVEESIPKTWPSLLKKGVTF